MSSTISKVLATISAVAIGGGIWIAKPAPELPQMENAVIAIQSDATIIPAHYEVRVIDTLGTLDSTLVPEYISRPQVRTAPDSAFRPGDVFRKVVYRNDSILFESRIAIEENTYPSSGVLKVHDYTQWIVAGE